MPPIHYNLSSIQSLGNVALSLMSSCISLGCVCLQKACVGGLHAWTFIAVSSGPLFHADDVEFTSVSTEAVIVVY